MAEDWEAMLIDAALGDDAGSWAAELVALNLALDEPERAESFSRLADRLRAIRRARGEAWN